MARKRVLILSNPHKPGVAEVIEALRGWFRQRVEITAELAVTDRLPAKAAEADLCVVFGGDGTLLAAARMLAGTGLAILGVNMGKLGFLAEFNVEHMQKHFDEILAGKVQATERMMLEVHIRNCGKHEFRSVAANDVVIAAGPPFRMIDLRVSQEGVALAQYFGDGLIVSSPTGSTGYNLSCGGPILEPTLNAMVITPIAPHSLSARPVVVRSDKAVQIIPNQVNEGTTVIIDGQVSNPVCSADLVEVRRAPAPARIISHPGRPFFTTLADKLQWGQSPHHH